MACKIEKSLARVDGCDAFSFGGVSKLYIGNKEDFPESAFTFESVGTTGCPINGITAIDDTTNKFYTMDFTNDTASYTEELQTGGNNIYVTQTVQFSISSIKSDELDFLEVLSLGKFVVILQRADGDHFILGYDSGEGLKAETLTNNSGATRDDEASAVVTLSGANLGYAKYVCQVAIDALTIT